MDKPEPIAPAIQEFFDEALPNGPGTHTLVLGENHDYSEHTRYLDQHLETLQTKHGLSTIGMELCPTFNALFWAYADGTLTHELGSKEKAQNYVRHIFTRYTEFTESAVHSANLAMHALDIGMRVVAFDTRSKPETLGSEATNAMYDIPLKNAAAKAGIPVSVIRKALRENPPTNTPQEEFAGTLWADYEIRHLIASHPEYNEKIGCIDRFIALGHQKIRKGQLTSDALSATLFDSLAAPRGNRLTIGGFAHINTIGDGQRENSLFPKKIDATHGTFGQHLFMMGQTGRALPHRVTRAVIAGSVHAHDIDMRQHHYLLPSHNTLRILSNEPIPLVHIDHGMVTHLPYPKETGTQVVLPAEKFPGKNHLLAALSPRSDIPRVERHLNPLLMPDIKAAADAIRTLMNGPEAAIRR